MVPLIAPVAVAAAPVIAKAVVTGMIVSSTILSGTVVGPTMEKVVEEFTGPLVKTVEASSVRGPVVGVNRKGCFDEVELKAAGNCKVSFDFSK